MSSNVPKTPDLGAIKAQEENNKVSGPLQHVELAKQNSLAQELSVEMEPGYDSNWVWSEITGANWNKNFPFQLHILEVYQKKITPAWTFTLPIPPSDLAMSMPFAINTTVTLGGIIEEHNGAPLRNISFSGTTGVYPLKGTTGTLKSTKGLAGEFSGIFAGTVNSISNIQTQVNGVVRNFRNAASALGVPGNSQNSPNLLHEEDFTDSASADIRSSGYYQFRLLQKFLERYSNLKKSKDGSKYRLALSIWKDEATYLVTPRSFDVRRSASSPFEYNYTISLLGWGRIKLESGPPEYAEGYTPIIRNPGLLRSSLNMLESARRVAQGISSGINTAAGDVENLVFEPIRGGILFIKDVLGVAITAADLPKNISSKFIKNAQEIANGINSIDEDVRKFKASLTDYATVENFEASYGTRIAYDRQGSDQSPNEALKVLGNLSAHLKIAEKIKVSSLSLPPSVQGEIAEERRRVRNFDRAHFEKVRDQISDFSADFADRIGAGNKSFNELNGRPDVPSTQTREPTESEYEILFALNSFVMELNRLAASNSINNNNFTTMDVLAGLASRSGIAFNVPTSKFAVPFPYGVTLERLAVQYLGDANRWQEIASLNGLRHPYVDEEGFQLPLLVNGNGNQVVVSNSNNLYIGQSVWVSSNTASRNKRRIINIVQNSDSSLMLTLDGDSDLDKYKVLSKAYIHAFLPDTVNSQMMIYIPSNQPAREDDFQTKSIPGVDEQDPYLQTGGVDLLLTQSGDLAITPDGDCRLAIGLTNLIQRLKIALETPKGSLIQHPDFGLGLRAGMSTADLNANQFRSAIAEIVKADGGFSGIQSAAILKKGPVAQVFVSVGVAGTNQFIPITFQVKK